MDNYLVPKGQKKLIEAVSSLNMAYAISEGEESRLDVVSHSNAVDGSPGYSLLFKNMRFDLGYQKSKVRFGLPYSDEGLENFKYFLEEKLNIKEYYIYPKKGIKYILEIELENYIYSDEGVDKIVQLTNKILEYL